MGLFKHHAIVITSWDLDLIDAAVEKGRELGLEVLGPGASRFNGFCSALVCPDGGKEGRPDSDAGDKRREKLRDWMNQRRYEDGSTSLEWVEIRYSGDLMDAVVETHAWDHDED